MVVQSNDHALKSDVLIADRESIGHAQAIDVSSPGENLKARQGDGRGAEALECLAGLAVEGDGNGCFGHVLGVAEAGSTIGGRYRVTV